MMSPVSLAADSQPDRQLKILARAFETLLLTTQQTNSKAKYLQERLEYAHDEVFSPLHTPLIPLSQVMRELD